MSTPASPTRSALFLDFDNIFIGLQEINDQVARRFATDPARWLDWFATGMDREAEEGPRQVQQRSLLVRRCYLNPRSFGEYRPYLTRAAISTVDCPALTERGKTSADIYMAMDILDTLQYRPHIEEFIILSADSDFTPVLLRLREFDRRTVGLAIGRTASAYRNAFDRMASVEVFIERGLGLSEVERVTVPPVGRIGVSSTVLDSMAEAVYSKALEDVNGELLAHELPPVFKGYPAFVASNDWLGFHSLWKLAEDLVRRRTDLHLVEGDPWRIQVRVTGMQPVVPAKEGTAQSGGQLAEEAELRARILEVVKDHVAHAPQAVSLASVAHEVINKLGDRVRSTAWAGAGSFKNLLQRGGLAHLQISADVPPGYLYDPERHERPVGQVSAGPAAEWFKEYSADLVEFAQRVHAVTDTPFLTPRRYGLVFSALADELRKEPFFLTTTSRAVRDRCLEAGDAIARQNISFILKGISFGGLDFSRFPADERPEEFASTFRRNLRSLIKLAQLELSAEEERLLNDWIWVGTPAEEKDP